MPVQRDRIGVSDGDAAAALARRLRDEVSADVNGNGSARRNGHDAIEVPSKREVAIDVCRAILAEAGAGTAEHSDDVVLITEAIGQRMGFSGAEAGDLLAAARLHDIGKVWVPSAILEKPGALTDEEWALMRRHTVVGQQILSSVSELADVGRLVRHSHERWDGKGYPDGLMGAEIPLGSRIVFCADAFHAIRSDRPYRKGRSAREALAEIKRCAGSQFDPAVAGALEEVVRERQKRPRAGGSSRLFALLMCLVVGGAGTALARSDLLGESGARPPSSVPTPPSGCGTAACPTVAAPIAGLAAVGESRLTPGPRALHPGLPGRLHGGIAGGRRRSADSGESRGERNQAEGNDASKGNDKAGESHSGGGSSSSRGGAARSSPSTSGSSGGGGPHPSRGHPPQGRHPPLHGGH